MDLATVRDLAAATPDSRNRVVDLLRAAAILVVVLGHWLIAAVTVREGDLVIGHLLELAPWTHPLTWVFQVMPVFFLVGGYANALSWRSARRRGETYAGWLRARLRRLLTPVVPLLLVWLAAVSVAFAAGVPASTLRTASQVALVPTWFLAAYVVVCAVGPATLWLWERTGWWSVAGVLALGGLVDLVSLADDNLAVGFANYLVVWASVHQLGYAWLDGRLAGTGRRLGLAAVGLGGTAVLVWAGPYPVSMIGLDDAVVNNSY
ncbi:MAG TPA: acyltransferase family protein, partial [Ornithinibacter sp.]|nr:acyltransferase family protein [Ornithinibacter sp.]